MSRRKIEVFRDDKVHVLAKPCATCIFGANSPVDKERTRGMLAQVTKENTVIPCHEWMDTKTPVVCRGLYNTNQVGMLQIASRMGFIQEDDLGNGPGFEDRAAG